MKMKPFIVLSMALLLFSVSCREKGKGGLPNITGRAGEMLIVIAKDHWEGTPGSTLRKSLAQSQVALPQDEPIFSLINVPHAAFKDIFHPTRNIVFVNIKPAEKEATITFEKDIWAYPQAVVKINAPSIEAFNQLFQQKEEKVISYFIKAEKERLIRNYGKYHAKDVDEVMKKENAFSIKTVPGMRINKKSENFAWMSYETPKISQGIIYFSFDYETDSTFTLDYLESKINAVLKKNIPGPTDGSYMKIEDLIDPILSSLKYRNNYAVEVRGLWETEHDFMGGPFLCLSVLDPKNNRVVNLFGYIYSPKQNKREYLRQVEAMLYSLEFPHQVHNDKLYNEAMVGEPIEEDATE